MIKPFGACPSPLMIITDHATAKEAERGEILSGPAGPELQRMCKEAGLEFGMAYVTAVVKRFPPGGKFETWMPETKKGITEEHFLHDEKWVSSEILEGWAFLQKEIEMVQPRVIVAMGNLAMWLLTEKWGLKTYRGSVLRYGDIVVIPTYPPSLIFTMRSQRVIAVQDLRRAKDALEGKNIDPPEYNFTIRPSFETSVKTLNYLQLITEIRPTVLSVDIETRSGHIMCLSIAWSKLDACCLPFVETQKGSTPYWSEDEEAAIIFLLYKLLTHPNARVIGQNFLYDSQYIYKAWHFIPRFHEDSMLMAHCIFTTMPKSLDFLASMYSSYYSQFKGLARELTKGSFKKDD